MELQINFYDFLKFETIFGISSIRINPEKAITASTLHHCDVSKSKAPAQVNLMAGTHTSVKQLINRVKLILTNCEWGLGPQDYN